MPRNFGISFEKVTTRPASGAQPPAGPHYSADTRADSNVIQLAALRPPGTVGLNSLAKERELSIRHRYDLGAVLFWAVVMVVPWLFVWSCVFFWFALFS